MVMGIRSTYHVFLIVGLVVAATACSTARPPGKSASVEPPASRTPPPPAPAPVPPPAPPSVERLPELFESRDFVVAFAKAGDTAESLAARYLGEPKKAWMIEDYVGARVFPEGGEVVIPKD